MSINKIPSTVSISNKGLAPKAPNDATKYLDGTGSYSVPTSNAAAKIPTDVSGLVLWLKADADVFKDAGVTPAINGDTVQQWNDQSGSGNNVSQATAGKRPTYTTSILNSLPILRFAAGQCLTLASLGVSTFSSFVVHRGQTTAGVILELGASVAANDGFLLYEDNAAIQVKKGAVLSSRNATVSWGIVNQFSIVGQHYNGFHAQHYFFIESSYKSIATATGNEPGSGTTTAALNIGARNNAASLGMTGDLGEIIIYTPAISLQDGRAIVQYLQGKWNL